GRAKATTGRRPLDALDGIEEVARGGPAGPDGPGALLEVTVADRQRDAETGGCPDRGRAADDHLLDRSGDLFRRAAGDIRLLGRQARLVQQPDGRAVPLHARHLASFPLAGKAGQGMPGPVQAAGRVALQTERDELVA